MDLQDKRIILTGTSSGIGQALLALLLKKGAKILAVDLEASTTQLPSVHYLQEDVSTQSGIDHVFETGINILGGIDIFIANAGFAYYQGVEKSDWAHTESILSTNVKGPIYAFYKLKKEKNNLPFQFVVTASAMSYMPLPGYSLYSATKHAVQGFFEAARHELPKNQVISLIYPIATKTAFYKKDTRIPFPNQSVEKVVKVYLKGIEKNKGHIFPSKSFFVVRHLSFLQPLVQKLEGHHFKVWRKKYE